MAEQEKRGRGRPAKEDALTPAERAKRYRDNKRAERIAIAISRDASREMEPPDAPSRLFAELDKALARVDALERELAQARAEIAALRAAK